MKLATMMALVLASSALANDPLPQSMYDLRQPELTVACSLIQKSRVPAGVRARTSYRVLGAPTARVTRPAAVGARHVGSDVVPDKPAFTLERHGLANAAGMCRRCGEKVSEIYAVLCLSCRAR